MCKVCGKESDPDSAITELHLPALSNEQLDRVSQGVLGSMAEGIPPCKWEWFSLVQGEFGERRRARFVPSEPLAII